MCSWAASENAASVTFRRQVEIIAADHPLVVRENRAQIWQISYPKGELRRFTNDLSNYSPRIDLSRDGKTLVSLDQTQIANVWALPGGKTSQATQITSGGVADEDVAPGPGGKLLVRSRGNELDLINADGSQRTVVMPEARDYSTMSNCGDRYIIFDSYTGNNTELWRTDADGSNPTRLVQQDVGDEDCSPDGKWLAYAISPATGSKILRMNVDGGNATEIANAPGGGGNVHISPDGKFVAFEVQEGTPVPEGKYVVVSVENGSRAYTFDQPSGGSGPKWSPDGKALQFLLTRNGATNVWEQPLSGGKPHPVTDFKSGRIFGFAWTRDGKQLLLSKGERTSDVVMISNFR